MCLQTPLELVWCPEAGHEATLEYGWWFSFLDLSSRAFSTPNIDKTLNSYIMHSQTPSLMVKIVWGARPPASFAWVVKKERAGARIQHTANFIRTECNNCINKISNLIGHTVVILMEHMIQLFTDSHNVYIWSDDDLYQKIARFSKSKLFFSSYVVLNEVQ